MTDEPQKGTLMSNTITNGNYYYTQSAYVQSAHYYSNQTIGSGDFQSAVLDKDEETPEISDAVAKEDTPAKKGYTRVITANIWNSGFGATQLADGKTAYSYQGVMQQFQIRIDVDGDTRKYTATGTDENGNEFSKEIDPYNVDPTDSDFTEFAALCSYIRDTEGLADEAMGAVDSVAPDDIFEKKNYMSELDGSIKNYQLMGVSTLGAEQLLSHINRLMEVMMTSGIGTGISPEPAATATSFYGAKVFGDTGGFGTFGSVGFRFQSITFEGTREIGGAEKTENNPEESEEYLGELEVRPLHGMGTIPVGNNNSYVMTASEVIKPGSDDKIVRVHVHDHDIDVNVDEVDPKNATVIEMFAYCQYADAHGTGTSDSFGSFHSMKSVIDPLSENSYSNFEEAMTKKQNWNSALSDSKVSFTKEKTGETIDASVVLKMLEETRNLFLSQGGDKDLGDLTDEEWENLLGDTDKNVEESKEAASKAQESREKEAERVKNIIEENWKNGKIQKAMDGYEFIRMMGEKVASNQQELNRNWKSTRERLLEQDPNAASRWYMYDNGSKRYSFDEFCNFMDNMWAEQRANARTPRNDFLDLANWAVWQKAEEV